jgi:hypothetical protein
VVVSLEEIELIRAYLEASKATWRSSVYDHFDITLCREMDARGRPKILSHPANIRARMSTGHGTKNIQDGVKACDKCVGTVTNTTTVKSTGQPYSAAAHRTLIAMRCAKTTALLILSWMKITRQRWRCSILEPFSLVLDSLM